MTNGTAVKLKYGGWGAVIGAALAMIVGFSIGGWVTGGTMAKMNEEAVLDSRSEICVAQFAMSPDYDEQLKAFKETDSWKRSRFVESGGWDKMPGEELARGYVASGCADKIEGLLTK